MTDGAPARQSRPAERCDPFTTLAWGRRSAGPVCVPACVAHPPSARVPAQARRLCSWLWPSCSEPWPPPCCRWRGGSQAAPRVLFGLAWLFLMVVGLSYTLRLRVSGDEAPLPADGPEPLAGARPRPSRHLATARETEREYTPGRDRAATTPRPERTGDCARAHSPGAPLLLAPLRTRWAAGPLCVDRAGAGRGRPLAGVWRGARRLRGGRIEAALLAWAVARSLRPSRSHAFEISTWRCRPPRASPLTVAWCSRDPGAGRRRPRPARGRGSVAAPRRCCRRRCALARDRGRAAPRAGAGRSSPWPGH